MRRPSPSALLAAVALVAWVCGPAEAQKPAAGEKYALLVGVRRYDPNELRSLPFSEADVTDLAAVLKESGYKPGNIVLMTQTTGAEDDRFLPRVANIRAELKLLLKDLDGADSVLIALAGHGVQFRGESDSYFCPAGTKLEDKATLLPLGEVYKELEASGAGLKLLMVDACRNDPQSDNSRSRSIVNLESVTRPQKSPPPGGVVAFFSCSEGEKAYEAAELKHGVFFHYVIETLKGVGVAEGEAEVVLPDLERHVKRGVRDFVREKYGVRQMPELRGTTRDLVPLVTLRRAPAPARPAEVARAAADSGRDATKTRAVADGAGMRAEGGKPPATRPEGGPPAPPADAQAFGGHAYRFAREVLTWHQAKVRCEQMGGHLATIGTLQENEFVARIAKAGAGRFGAMDGVWLGATDEAKEGSWAWVDGSKFSYTKWNAGQPNDKQNGEDFLLLWLPKDAWADQPDASQQHTAYFVCEWDRPPGSDAGSGQPGDLQGEWVMTVEELNGARDTVTERRDLRISGDDFVMSRTRGGKRGTYSGKVRFDAGHRSFDFAGTGPNGRPQEFQGIYQVEGDALRLCYVYSSGNSAQRPTRLRSYAVPGVTMVSLVMTRTGGK